MYNPLNSGLSTLEANDSSYKIETPKEEITMHLTNAVSFEEYEKATKIYGESFAYYISLDTLKLIAPNVKIRAIRYRTIEDLLKNIKP